jgi:predicted nucleic acid-binding protein
MYEFGNIIWKNNVLQATSSEQDSKKMARVIRHTLTIMDILGIAGSEEEILDTAMKNKIAFYDASYVYYAKAKELRLITEDLRLIKIITPTINVSTLDDIK